MKKDNCFRMKKDNNPKSEEVLIVSDSDDGFLPVKHFATQSPAKLTSLPTPVTVPKLNCSICLSHYESPELDKIVVCSMCNEGVHQ
jgi:hypothetical protein